MNGLPGFLRRLEGPQTVGRGPAFWIVFAITLAIACAYPLFSDGYTVGNTVYFFVWVFIALSLCLIWGYGGSLSFGQTAFFGIAGVFLGIVTLAVTLMLERFMAQTAGPEWHVGVARLNGFNGMSAMPPLTIPWPGGDIVLFADIGLYYFVLGLLVLVYLGLRILMNSRFGNVIVAIRENPERAEMLGYDVRKYQLVTFVIGAALAGISGVLYTVWGQYITPSSMGMTAAALPLIWVAVGGRSDLTSTVIGTLVVLAAFQALTIYGSQYALVFMGVLLVLTVLIAPNGLVLGAMNLISRLAARRSKGGV